MLLVFSLVYVSLDASISIVINNNKKIACWLMHCIHGFGIANKMLFVEFIPFLHVKFHGNQIEWCFLQFQQVH